MEECAECGFDERAVSEENAADTIRALGPRYHTALFGRGAAADADVVLRERPAPRTWSALEYTAHMRDVIAMWGWGLHQALTVEHAQLPAVDTDLPDRVAAETDYNRQDPAAVTQELSGNAERMASKDGAISADQWRRKAVFGDVEVTPLWIVRKVAHEGEHHLWDIEMVLQT